VNLDKVIKAVNANGTIRMQYSTPSLYVKAKNAEKVQWPTKTDDYVSTTAFNTLMHRSIP
jgi:alpha-mannosidase